MADNIITPLPFSRADATRIRASAHSGRTIVCPRWRDPLTYGPQIPRPGHAVRELYCSTCQRGIMVPVD